MHNSLLSCIRVNGELADLFDCPNGVRQGCVLSPTLFCLFINQLAEHVQVCGKHGVQLLPGLMELFILFFSEDVTLLTKTPSGLQNQLNCQQDCCAKLGIEVNESKTKVMVFRKGGHLGTQEKWFYNGKLVNMVNSYSYLGFTINVSYNRHQKLFQYLHMIFALACTKTINVQYIIHYQTVQKAQHHQRIYKKSTIVILVGLLIIVS